MSANDHVGHANSSQTHRSHSHSNLSSPASSKLPVMSVSTPSVPQDYLQYPSQGNSQGHSSDRPRFLSEADCHEVAKRLSRVTQGGGYTSVSFVSTWTGNIRWARNQITTSGDVRNNVIEVERNIDGARNGPVLTNDISDIGLMAAARRAERLCVLHPQELQSDLTTRYQIEPFTAPNYFSEATYQLDADKRAEAARHLMKSAADAGLLSAGYIEVSAHSWALIDTFGRSWYYPYTEAQYSVTVRDPKGTASGWAGVDWYDWAKIDGDKISAIALDKCLRTRNSVAVEPGRYTVILEPQAVCDFIGQLVLGNSLDRESAEGLLANDSPFCRKDGFSKLGERVIDERITINADPMDLELGIPPFNLWWLDEGFRGNSFAHPIFHAATWIDKGVLVNLAYSRNYGSLNLHQDTGLPNSGSFRMSGGTTSIEEMISTTARGLLVTRFDRVSELDKKSLTFRGNTRDGLWLIEKGKISKPVKNMTFTESVLFALNNVDQLGVPQRVFHPTPNIFLAHPQPVIVPPLKIRDFSFTALDDAI